MAVCGKICKVLCCKCSSESLEPATPRSPPPNSAHKKTTLTETNEHFAKVGPKGPQSVAKGGVVKGQLNAVKAALIQSTEDKGKNQGLDSGNKEYSDYINSAKAKIRTMSTVGGGDRGGDGGSTAAAAGVHSGKSATRRDSLNDKFTDYIVRAKNKITKTSTMVGIGRSVTIK